MLNTVTIKDIIYTELGGLYGHDLIKELNDVIKCYEIYEGTDENLVYQEDWDVDFETTKKNHNFIKELIDKQNRFMFGFTPTFEALCDSEDPTLTEYLKRVLKYNKFSSKLLKGEKDCSIGKRIAIKLGVDENSKKIRLRFVNSLEFIYETSDDDSEEITKVIFFYQLNDKQDKEEQRIFKQVYDLENGRCFCAEGIYNGLGQEIEVRRERSYTGLDFIPVYIVLNGGLSGDLKGESDVKDLVEDQKDYNRLDSGDTDALIKGMFESIYGVNLSQESAESVKKAPGMFYDLQGDPAALENGGSVSMGVLSHTFSYSETLEKKLARCKQAMYGALDVPIVSPSELQGFITSGKGLKGLYWQQIVRCESKMMEWKPALEWIGDTIIKLTKIFNLEKLTDEEYSIVVSHRYALPDDKEGELLNDLSQVNAQVMSKKDFIIKWAEVAPEAADKILEQIQIEKELLEDSFSGMSGFIDDPDNNSNKEE